MHPEKSRPSACPLKSAPSLPAHVLEIFSPSTPRCSSLVGVSSCGLGHTRASARLVLAPRAAGASSPAAPESCGVGGTPSHREGPQVQLHVVFMGQKHVTKGPTPSSGRSASSQEGTRGLVWETSTVRVVPLGAGLGLTRAGKATASPNKEISCLRLHSSRRWGPSLLSRVDDKQRHPTWTR